MEIKKYLKYPKIYRFNHKEANIDWAKPYWVSEKLDGTSTQISKQGYKLFLGKRSSNIELTSGGMYLEFCRWVAGNYNKLQKIIPEGYILFGELTKGQGIGKTGKFKSIGRIKYEKKFPFMLFDIFNFKEEKWLEPDDIIYKTISINLKAIGAEAIPHSKLEGIDKFKKIKENLSKTKSQYGDLILEGVVIKQYSPRITLKLKNESEFKPHKTKSPQIISVVKDVITPERIDKIKRKINYKSIKQIGELGGMVIKDALEEEEDYLRDQGWKQFKKQFHKVAFEIIKAEIL